MSSSQRWSIPAEIHSHSTQSDGAFAPAEVAARCAAAGVRVWSLTDHDTVDGCAEAAEAAEEHGMAFISGMELSAWSRRSIHVLGYGFDLDARGIANFSERRLQARQDRMRKMVELLKDLGYPVDFDAVLERAKGAVARPHLAEALLEAGHVKTKQEAFDRFIHNDGPAYYAATWPSVPQAIELIHEAGGVAVLAHPGLYDNDDEVPKWAEMGLDGIEVRHPRHRAGDEARYAAMANDLGLIKTASSDYHGPDHEGSGWFGTVEIPSHWFEPLAERVGIEMSTLRPE